MNDAITGVLAVPVIDTLRGPAAALQYRLVCIRGDDVGTTFRIGESIVEIGRGIGDIVLSSASVSRKHARFGAENGEFFVHDLDSANGTYVNGSRVRRRVAVRFGDRLQFGSSVFLFSQRDELEARVERLQRLEGMATLAAGIAHDFNNALAVIAAGLEHIDEAIPASETDARESLADMQRATKSATTLAKRLLRMGRQEPMTIGVVSLAGIAEGAVALARRRSGGRQIRFETDVSPMLQVMGAADELQNVLLNLYINAMDAMPDGGSLTTRARAITCSEAEVTQHQLAAVGEYVQLTVTDTGTGMDEATLARAFEPFFTTKSVGHGTGLGLAMIHATVRRHGGAVEVRSTPGQGTTFRILLQRLKR